MKYGDRVHVFNYAKNAAGITEKSKQYNYFGEGSFQQFTLDGNGDSEYFSFGPSCIVEMDDGTLACRDLCLIIKSKTDSGDDNV